MRFSASLMTMERRSAPIKILSLARSNSSMPTMRLLARAANRAASFTRLARSAPEKPGVQRRLHVIGQRYAPHVHAKYLFAAAHIGQRHHDLAVEAPGPQQRRVEHVGTVRGGDDDDALVALEAVHFHQQLVERLFALVVTAAEARAAVPADRVDLVDKDDARGMFLRLLEHVAHA